MHDGKIVSDKMIKKKKKRKKEESAGDDKEKLDKIISGESKSIKKAEIGDYIRQALNSIFSHKLRSFLSMLGILIGVAAVISMLAIGQGAKDEITQTLSSLGSNLLRQCPGHTAAMELRWRPGR